MSLQSIIGPKAPITRSLVLMRRMLLKIGCGDDPKRRPIQRFKLRLPKFPFDHIALISSAFRRIETSA